MSSTWSLQPPRVRVALWRLALRTGLLLSLIGIGLWVGCNTTPPATSDAEEEDKPEVTLSEPIPLPGNHRRIPIRRPTDDGLSDQASNQAGSAASPPATPDTATPNTAAPPAAGNPPSANRGRVVVETEFDPSNLAVKPGHWVTLQSDGSTTQDTFSGDLKYSLRRGDARPRVVPGTRYYLRSQRPVTLAKDQTKRFETPLFMIDTNQLTVQPELLTRSGGEIYLPPHRMPDLLPHQYHLVVLSDQPDSYNFLNLVPSIRNAKLNSLIGDWLDQTSSGLLDAGYADSYRSKSDATYYKLTLSKWNSTVELPAGMQQWTSIAYLIWGDFDPARLSAEQQTALVDWLHFGGQLIVGGDAVETLSQSFLQSYLPVEPTGSVNEPYSSLRPLLEHWSLQRDASGQLMLPNLEDNETFVRTQWTLTRDGRDVPHCNGLVAERQVGKGRIVSTAFALQLPRLRGWSSLDHWFNSCLLRRPGRQHRAEDDIFQTISNQNAADTSLTGSPIQDVVGFNWRSDFLSTFQPSVYTSLDFAARDWVASNETLLAAADGTSEPRVADALLPTVTADGRRFGLGSNRRSQAAWNDYSDVSQAARASLKDQAGITPPSREWVLQALIIYLVILVPVNYVIFRLLRRLEWAWFSIPVIAVTGAFVVVRAASLDIGFSNKQLQIQLLEIPTDYQRGHLTGYGSLYSSLTTRFRFQADNPTTVALPFPSANTPAETSETPLEFSLEPGRPMRFGPQEIVSNTMEMYQFQQVVDLGGRLEYLSNDATTADRTSERLRNGTRIKLSHLGLFRMDDRSGRVLFAHIADLAAGGEADIPWQVLPTDETWLNQWQGTCLEDFGVTAGQWMSAMLAVPLDPDQTAWPVVAESFRSTRPEWSEALERAARRLGLPREAKFSNELLAAAVRENAVDGLGLGNLFRAVLRQPLGPEEVRLVAWTDDAVHQWEIQPAASQSDHRSLVLAHLRAPQLPPLGYDQNLAYSASPPPTDEPSDETLDEAPRADEVP